MRFIDTIILRASLAGGGVNTMLSLSWVVLCKEYILAML